MDVRVIEVGPRDGLQNEQVHLSVAERVELITRLVDAGATRIEAVAFAHPGLVPAMAGAEEVMAALHRSASARSASVSYSGLVLNRRGSSARSTAGSTRSTWWSARATH